MNRADTARPVSGEIMSRRAFAPIRVPNAAADIVEAEFVTEAPGPRVEARQGVVDGQGLTTLRRTTGTRTSPGSSGAGIPWLVGLAAILTIFWVSGGHAVFDSRDHGRPAGGSFTVSEVVSRIEWTGRRGTLRIDGRAGNIGSFSAVLPDLDIRVKTADGAVLHYRLGTAGPTLAPGQRLDFASRLDAPRSDVRTVTVAFAD